MKKKIKAVLFDLDGTLFDTAPDLAAACNAVLVKHGLKALEYEQILTQVNAGMRAMLKLGIPSQDLNHYDLEGRMRDDFAAYYLGHIAVCTRPYPGIIPLVTDLKRLGIKLGIITNKYEHMALKLLCCFPFTSVFDLVIGGDTLPYTKPDPRPLLYALNRLEVKPHEAVYIGDSLSDIKAAAAAGCISAVAGWGYASAAGLNPTTFNADLYAASAIELRHSLSLKIRSIYPRMRPKDCKKGLD